MIFAKSQNPLRHGFRRASSPKGRLGHIILENRSGTYSSKMAVRDKLYTRFGSLLWNVESFRKWHHHHAGLENITIKGETGLVMPKSVPLTTIIIPAYNNIELTRRCIHSIYRIKSRSPFEIVVVDDCSKDDYASLTRDFPEVRVIRNQKNSGFLLTANHGAKVAKGEYILFLNNDTEVAPGWLDELTTALSKHSEAGMIGSQLIYLENGKLQESGNLICKNGEMLPLGRGEDPNHPRYAFFREVGSEPFLFQMKPSTSCAPDPIRCPLHPDTSERTRSLPTSRDVHLHIFRSFPSK